MKEKKKQKDQLKSKEKENVKNKLKEIDLEKNIKNQ